MAEVKTIKEKVVVNCLDNQSKEYFRIKLKVYTGMILSLMILIGLCTI